MSDVIFQNKNNSESSNLHVIVIQGEILTTKPQVAVLRMQKKEMSHRAVHLFIHSFIPPFIYPFIHPSIHPSISSFIFPPTHSFIHSFIPPFIYPSIHLPIHSSIHPFVHLPIYSFIHSPFHPTHSLFLKITLLILQRNL